MTDAATDAEIARLLVSDVNSITKSIANIRTGALIQFYGYAPRITQFENLDLMVPHLFALLN